MLDPALGIPRAALPDGAHHGLVVYKGNNTTLLVATM
jgi:hypothetical protein